MRIKVALISIAASLLVLFMKWFAYQTTNSAALKSDALESVVNVVAAVFLLGALLFAEQPADQEHPYGHGKIEFFSAVFEGGLISFASVMIIYEAILSLITGSHIENLDTGLMISVAAGILNGGLGWYLIHTGKKMKSAALIADGKHIFSDFITTAGILAGLLVVKFTGLVYLDPIIAIGIGLLLGWTGLKLVSHAANALLDTQDPELIKKIVDKVNEFHIHDVIALHEMRAMRSGRHVHVDLHIVVPEFYEVRRAHDFVEAWAKKILQEAGLNGEVHSHIDPCYRDYCRQCAVKACPVRKEELDTLKQITTASAIKPEHQ